MGKNTQMEEMVNAWTNVHRQLWGNWGSITEHAQPDMKWPNALKSPMDVSRDMMNNALKIQSERSNAVLKSLEPGNEAPEFSIRYAEQLEDVVQNWFNAQQKAMDSWYSAFSTLDPMHSPVTRWNASVADTLKAWQDATEKVFDTQSQLISSIESEAERFTRTDNSKSARVA